VAVIVISLRSVPESRDEEDDARPDLAGAVLATLGLGGLTFGLIESSRLGWTHPLVPGSIVTGAAALAGFLAVEARVKDPMMPLSLFRSRTFAEANLLTLWLYAAMGGALFFLPFNLIQVHRYTATAAGAALLPFIILMFLLSRWAGGLADRHGPRLPLTVGPAVVAAGYLLFAFLGSDGTYWTDFFPAILVLGFGMSICVAPLTTAVLGAVEKRHAGIASGINTAVSRSAGLLAIAALGVLMLGLFERGLDSRLAEINLPPAARQAMMEKREHLAAMEIPPNLGEPTRGLARAAVNGAFLDGFRGIMLAAAGLSVLAAISGWVMIGRDGDAGRKKFS
jgi:hypothetical protein